MENPEDKYKHLERIERQIQEKEVKLQLRKSDAEVHKTVKHQPEASGKLWQKKTSSWTKVICFWDYSNRCCQSRVISGWSNYCRNARLRCLQTIY